MALLEETGAWLYDEGITASLPTLRSKAKHLHSLADPAFHRRSERERRDEVVSMYLGHILFARNQTANITKTHEVEEEEHSKFLEYLQGEEEGVLALYQQQKSRALDVDPLFTSHDLEAKQKEIEKRVKAFRIRPRRKPKVVKLNVTETKEEEEKGEAAEGEEQHEAPREGQEDHQNVEQTFGDENAFDEL